LAGKPGQDGLKQFLIGLVWECVASVYIVSKPNGSTRIKPCLECLFGGARR